MNAIVKFDTASVAPPERLKFWNALVDEVYEGTYVNAADTAFSAKMWQWTLGDLAMIRPRSQASVVGRRPVSPASDNRFVMHLQRRGTSQHEQRGHQTLLAPGDMVISAAFDPYRVDLSHDHELLVVEFDRAKLADRMPGSAGNTNEVCGRLISGSAASARILHDFLLSLWQQGDQGHADADWQQGVSNVFFDLVALALRYPDQPVTRRGHAEVRGRAVRLIESRLSDPELRASSIADDLGVSVRTIHNMFAAQGDTPGGYILGRRLDRAAERLTAEPRTGSITDIAFDLGFNDSAYFTRCFRQRFGVPPSAYKAAQ